MTDEQIVEPLKYCSKGATISFMCPLYNKTYHCVDMLAENALDLIKRQKTEIERLKSMNQAKLDCIHDLQKKNEILSRNADTAFQDGLNERRDLFAPEIKFEAYKEFAERLKSYLLLNEKGKISVITFEEVEKLLKELVGENK